MEDGKMNGTGERLARGSGWVPVPVWLIGYVSDGALATWLAVAAHVNARSATAWPGIPLLARERRITERSVQRHLRELEAAGALTCTPSRRPDGSNGSNTYRLAAAPPMHNPVDNPVHDAVDNPGGGDTGVGGVVTEVSPHELEPYELHPQPSEGSCSTLTNEPGAPVDNPEETP